MAARILIDADKLVYRYDWRFPDRQTIAAAILRESIAAAAVRAPHQAIVDFVAAVTR